jgi:AcrR family transcriptional regulator
MCHNMSVSMPPVRRRPDTKILAAARKIFSEKGYSVAGINEIIAESRTSKKSFYNYYPSKKSLGEAYISAEKGEALRFMDNLMSRHRGNFAAFAHTWAYSLSKAARCGIYFGCPFSNTAAQAWMDFYALLNSVMTEWREKLSDYLGICGTNGDRHQRNRVAEKMLILYEGAIQMWRLTGETIYFSLFEEMLCDLAGVSHTKNVRQRPSEKEN